MIVEYTKLDPAAITPRNAHGDDAGWDLFALEDTAIPPYKLINIRSGIAVAIPQGYYGRITARSSTLRKRGLHVVEGIIDCGWRGELFSTVYHDSPWDVPVVKAGETVAQLIIHLLPRVRLVETGELPEHRRGLAGFGSTGV